MGEVRAGRVYDDPVPSDGRRVLVDRLWPRGLRKDAAAIDEWLKAVAPSDELRNWYGHDPARFARFRWRYDDELRNPERKEALRHLRDLAAQGPLTLLTATRDVAHSQAADLADRLNRGYAGEEEEGGDAPCWLRRVCPACGSIADSDPPVVCEHCGEMITGE